jgi:hypothetical protein
MHHYTSPIMASDDMVFVESGPSMQLISSSSIESSNASSLKDFSHTYPPASPNITAPLLGCNPRGIAIRSKPGSGPYPPVPRNSVDSYHCCHGSCQRDDKLGLVDDSFEMPPNNLELPPPPACNGSSFGWLKPGAHTKLKKSTRIAPSESPSFQVSHLLIKHSALMTREVSAPSTSGKNLATIPFKKID